MQYLWEKFNIKTFPAKTIVFADGAFQPELSDFDADQVKVDISKDKISIDCVGADEQLPTHLIFVGEIAGKKEIKIKNHQSQNVFLTAKFQVKKPAFLDIFIENAGKDSEISADLVFLNESELKLNIFADHLDENTGLFVKNRVLAGTGSATDLFGVAKIVGGCPDCRSDISFSAMCARDIKYIKMSPNQKIASVPAMAEHSANLWRGTNAQIEYLETAGLSLAQIDALLREAFLNA